MEDYSMMFSVDINSLPLFNRALLIAATHHTINDKCGIPYVMHPVRVSKNVDSPDEKVVALLHDILEDTKVTKQDLINWGFPQEIIEAVEALTFDKKVMTKGQYLRCIKANPIARNVKIADIEDNYSLNRIPNNERIKFFENKTYYSLAYIYLVSDKEDYFDRFEDIEICCTGVTGEN
jgi:hypothetical protein